MKPNTIPLLKGKEAKKFAKYQSRVPTQEEIDYAKRADAFYQLHCPGKAASKLKN